MLLKKVLFGFFCLFAVVISHAQPCTTLGQTPSTAIPICGIDTFSQSVVPNCGGTPIPVPCNDNAGYSDIRPFWYKFTCFTGGTLGFTVTPNNFDDDYDWQIFDITGRNPNDVYTNSALFVACNWSSNPGPTGTRAGANSLINCAGPTFSNMSRMPTLIQGHEYIILLSNFSPSQQGYKLSFGGGTASITDPKNPAFLSGFPNCEGTKIGIKLNKKMKCSSLAANASDFILTPANGTITSVTGFGCSGGFEMDSIEITMNGALPPGTYTLSVRNGTDLNTLLDNCNRNIPVGTGINFTVFPIVPTPMDSITPVACAPNELQLVFRTPISCASIAASGSDFSVSGPSAVSVIGASGTCSGNIGTRLVRVRLAQPIQLGGTYQIRLQTGGDGNTLIDDCGQESPPSVLNFTVRDTVSADFNYQALLGCITDTIRLSHDGRNGVNSWTWLSNNSFISNQQSFDAYYTVFGIKQIKLSVTNGVCTDSSTVTVNLDNQLTADFSYPDVICPNDLGIFVDRSIGKIQNWNWNFGNGITSTDRNPSPQRFTQPTNTREIFYTARLIIQNDLNCLDTATYTFKAVNTCLIAVPNAFTPNNDGKNDFLYPLNAYKADNLIFRVFNRFGQMVFETRDWTKKWDGTVNGQKQGSGTFVWVLSYIDRDTGQPVFKKGTTVIIR